MSALTKAKSAEVEQQFAAILAGTVDAPPVKITDEVSGLGVVVAMLRPEEYEIIRCYRASVEAERQLAKARRSLSASIELATQGIQPR